MTFKSCSMLLAMAAALSLTACRQESLEGTTAEEGDVLYISAAVALPSAPGTRSSTDDGPDAGEGDTNSNATPDYEYGWAYENDVRSMILVIANKDDEYVTHTVVKGITQAPTTDPTTNKFDFIVNGEIKHSDMKTAYESGPLSEDKTVKIYAFCNYTTRLLNLFENPSSEGVTTGYENWMDWAGTVEEDPSPAGQSPTITNTIWAKNSFLMTNAKPFTTGFPAELDDWDEYADKDNPYKLTETKADYGKNLSPIYVERAAARIDFRDGSKNKEGNGPNDNTYRLEVKVSDATNAQTKTLNLFSVKLTRMALVNMSKNFYYLRRVSANGLNTGSEISGKETPSNYVVDTDADIKVIDHTADPSGGMTPENAGKYFNFCLYEDKPDDITHKYPYAMGNWYVDNIDDILEPEKDNDTWKGTNGGTYKIWRYVTENTIPTIDQQKTIQSVGVIFKGSIIPGDDLESSDLSEDVKSALNNVKTKGATSPTLYSFNNILYAGIQELVDATKSENGGGQGSPIWNAVDATLTKMDNGNLTDGYDASKFTDEGFIKDFNNTVPDNGVTVYVPSNENDGEEWGYYCYYFYWNRHNDNGKSGRMGIMEFATVRNNVYKLSVTGINQLGHPRDPNHDPDPEEPEDPDEDPTDYIQVQVEVLPWVVRVNNIEF